jgi:hypothetical protein
LTFVLFMAFSPANDRHDVDSSCIDATGDHLLPDAQILPTSAETLDHTTLSDGPKSSGRSSTPEGPITHGRTRREAAYQSAFRNVIRHVQPDRMLDMNGSRRSAFTYTINVLNGAFLAPIPAPGTSFSPLSTP